MSTATGEGDDAQAAALLARLQAQFGDMDVQGMLLTSSAADAADPKGTTDNCSNDEPDNGPNEDVHYESDESSVIDPTPEELAAWQAAQYQTAKWGRESLAQKAAAEEADANENGSLTSEQLTEWIQVEGPPDLNGQESAFLAPEDDPTLTELANEEPLLNGPWQRLYSSNTDGLSYAGLVCALRGYDGPTVLLLGAVPPPAASYVNADSKKGGDNARKTATIGYYTATAWKESGVYYGNQNCFLFTTSADGSNGDGSVQIFRPNSESNDEKNTTAQQPRKTRPINYQFCHSTIAAAVVSDGRKPGQHPDDTSVGPRGRAVVQVPPGLGVGESRGIGPRLHIAESLEGCRALPYDDAFAAGPLLPPFFGDNPTHSFDVDVMEAWGVGGSERIQRALAARKRDRSFKEASRKRNAEVDKTQFLDHFRSDMVHSKAFAHARHTSGRVDDCELESDGSMLSHLG